MLPRKVLKRLQRLRQRRKYGRAPELTEAQILAWADEFHARTGRWPKANSGRVTGGLGLKWHTVDGALYRGSRGLEKGSSLARLLARRRGVPNRKALPLFTEKQILAWADRHQQRTGQWPRLNSGAIPEAPAESWLKVNAALEQGSRGLAGGTSLARFLAEHRGARNKAALPRLSEQQILAWADAYHQRHGIWPFSSSGAIPEAPGETWSGVHSALHMGGRGLRRGSSLPRLLTRHRGVRNLARLPPLTEEQILAWAGAFRKRTANWPNKELGAFIEAPGETWRALNKALREGIRGLRGGSTLADLLARRRGVPNRKALPRLSDKQIVAWADAHHRRTGKWPGQKTGRVMGTERESWLAIDAALRIGGRGSSLAQLLAQRRGVPNKQALPRLSVKKIRAWAEDFRRRHGHWPRVKSGQVPAAPHETWQRLENALRHGLRGLPGGSSLARVLGHPGNFV